MKQPHALLSGLLIAVLASCSPSESGPSKDSPNYQAYESSPKRSFWVSVERGATTQFHDRLANFAQRNKMGMWKSTTSPDQRNFSIAMQGDQLQLIAVNDAELYEVALYPKKTSPISDASLDAFVSEIRADLGSVGGVTFPTFSKRPYPK